MSQLAESVVDLVLALGGIVLLIIWSKPRGL
jgi:hypothetical protein